MKRCVLLAMLALTAASYSQTATYFAASLPKLRVGEKAPALNVYKWVKGGPTGLGAGKVTVVEFWASWCPTCYETYAHVADLSRRYKGKANFVGVSVYEKSEDVQNGSYVGKVQHFASALGEDMPYPIAVDDQNGTVAREWLGPGDPDIPKAFIVDQRGRIAWTGHPLADLDDVLAKVVSGHFDLSRAAQEQQAQVVAAKELLDLVNPIQDAVNAGKPQEAVQAIDVAVKKKPMLETGFGPMKFQMLLRYDEPSAYAYARELAAGVCRDSATQLNLIAWSIVDDDAHLKNPDLATAIEIAKRAYELTDQKDAYVLDTLAYALYKNGQRDKALNLQMRAVNIAENTKNFNPKILQDLHTRLNLMRKSNNPPTP